MLFFLIMYIGILRFKCLERALVRLKLSFKEHVTSFNSLDVSLDT